jgi:preprotein translocase subunit YajC
VSHHFAQPSPAPGRDTPQAATTAQESAPAAKDAPGAASGSSSPFGGQWMIFVLFIPIVLMLLMSRNQNKKQKQLEESLKVGDKVVTQSGLLGRISEMDPRLVKLEIAPGVKVEVLKSTVQGKYVPTEDKAEKSDAKDAKDAKEDKPQEKKA